MFGYMLAAWLYVVGVPLTWNLVDKDGRSDGFKLAMSLTWPIVLPIGFAAVLALTYFPNKKV